MNVHVLRDLLFVFDSITYLTVGKEESISVFFRVTTATMSKALREKKPGKLRAEREDQRIVVTHFLRSYIKTKKLCPKKLQSGRENVLTSRRAGVKCGPYFCPEGRQMCQHEESINGSSWHCVSFFFLAIFGMLISNLWGERAAIPTTTPVISLQANKSLCTAWCDNCRTLNADLLEAVTVHWSITNHALWLDSWGTKGRSATLVKVLYGKNWPPRRWLHMQITSVGDRC